MEQITSNIEQIKPVNTESTGIFSVIQQSITNFNESLTQDQPAVPQHPETSNFMTDLTEFDMNSSEYQIFNSNDNESFDRSFNSTLSATEIDNDMDIEVFVDAEQLFDAENVDDLAELMKLTGEFPLLDEIMEEEFAAVTMAAEIQQMTKLEDIKSKIVNQVPVREEFKCQICQKNFTAYTSLTRHYKTQKHQRMEAMTHLQESAQFQQNHSYIQRVQSVLPLQKNHQKMMNFVTKTRESRNQLMDQNRMTTETEEEFLNIQHDQQQVAQSSPKTTASPNATKTAIENSIKILSKLNAETLSKTSEQTVNEETSPKKQNSMKQLTLTGMTFSKPATESIDPEQSTELEFDFDAEALLGTFTQEPESELVKYIQSITEDISEPEEQQELTVELPMYEIVISNDSNFTINKLPEPDQIKQHPKTGIAKIMSQKKQQRIQRDISSSPLGCFKCEFCSKTFSTQSNLRRHEHLHAAKKQHSCKVCGKAFMQKEYLKKHMVTH